MNTSPFMKTRMKYLSAPLLGLSLIVPTWAQSESANIWNDLATTNIYQEAIETPMSVSAFASANQGFQDTSAFILAQSSESIDTMHEPSILISKNAQESWVDSSEWQDSMPADEFEYDHYWEDESSSASSVSMSSDDLMDASSNASDSALFSDLDTSSAATEQPDMLVAQFTSTQAQPWEDHSVLESQMQEELEATTPEELIPQEPIYAEAQSEAFAMQTVLEPMLPEASPEEDYFSDDDLASGVTPQAAVEDTFSIDFEEEEVRSVLRSIADLYNLNIVIPEHLSGQVSIKLRNVTWPEVFDAVLDPIGFSYIDDGRIIRVKSIDDIRTEPMETEIFPLRFSTASDISKSIKNLVDTDFGGRVLADKRTNTLMVTERPSQLRKLSQIIGRLDAAESQIMIETKIAETKIKDILNVGFDWGVLNEYTARIGNNGNSATTTTAPLAGISRTFIPSDSTATRSDSFVFNADQFKLVLNALDQDDDTKIIASPNIVTMNNTLATINISERQPVPNFTYNEQTGNFQVSGFDYMDIGVNLEVTPKAQQDLITLDVKPEVSDSTSGVVFNSGVGSTQIPVVNSRRSHSIITLKSGYTLALGGMKRKDVTNSKSAVPFLGSIPGVKRLFSTKKDNATDTNLVIFVTATKIGFDGTMQRSNDYEAGPVKNLDPRMMLASQMERQDVPGYQLTDEEKAIIEQAQSIRDNKNWLAYESKLKDEMKDIHAADHNKERYSRHRENAYGPGKKMAARRRNMH